MADITVQHHTENRRSSHVSCIVGYRIAHSKLLLANAEDRQFNAQRK